jgi:hypothetical protein
MHRRVLLAATLLLATQACTGGSSSGTGGDGHSTACGPGLANLSDELAYAVNYGYGQVLIVNDPTLQDTGNASLVNHQFIIRFNESILAALPPPVAAFMRYHEFGHMYLEHIPCLADCKYVEYQADAYAARVLFQTEGAPAVQLVAQYWASSGSPGDQSHRTGAERAAYILEVLTVLQAGQSQTAPEPPWPVCSTQTTGTLGLFNPSAFETIFIYLNNQYAGFLFANQTAFEQLLAGPYSVTGLGSSSGAYYNFGVLIVDRGGLTTNY